MTPAGHRARLATALAATVLLSTAGGATAASPEPLARVDRAAQAFANPSRDAKRLETVSRERPITGTETVLPVIGSATDAGGSAWLRVRLPGRPNGHTGWIAAAATTPESTEWQITIHTVTRTVTVLRNGQKARTFRSVVGKPSTPTPHGRFFVEETVALPNNDVGTPYALALSARSNVLQEFAGGPGQIALHGTNNIGGTLGTAVSHGCIRLDTRAVTWLGTRIGPGIPVTITR